MSIHQIISNNISSFIHYIYYNISFIININECNLHVYCYLEYLSCTCPPPEGEDWEAAYFPLSSKLGDDS